MNIQILPQRFSVCRLAPDAVLPQGNFYFTARTNDECSLVLPTADVPPSVTDREDGWRAFRVAGVLDFSLVGVLEKLSGVLAAAQVSIFAVSTYNTDYLFVREQCLTAALSALRQAGYRLEEAPPDLGGGKSKK